MDESPRQPLAGLRVLDLTRVLAGPLCTMMLGDLGAQVIKIERPRQGDDTRGWGPPFDERGESAYFLSVNRNKLSLAADLDLAEDRTLIEELVADARVVVDNFRPGTLERRGLDPFRLLARHRELIWCTITGFGSESARPGYDFVAQAEQGWMAITGEPDGEPQKVGVALADVIAGKDATVAILSCLAAGALSPGARSAEDRRLVVSLAASATAALVNAAQNALVTGVEARRWGNAHPNLVPYQYFPTEEGGLVIAVGSDSQWLACARALGLTALAEEERFRTNAGRVRERESLVELLGERLLEAPANIWRARLDEAGVPCGEVRGVLEAVVEAGGSPLFGMPPSVPGGSIRLPPPLLDEHGVLIKSARWGAFQQLQATAALPLPSYPVAPKAP